MAMNMRCRDQSWSGRAVDCFDIGIECGREIHGENEVLLKVKFCEGKGCSSLWNEVCKDSCVMSWCHLVFSIIEISCDEPPTISMKWGLCEDWCDVVMPLSFLYNSNFMRWMTNYLYEMRFGEMMGDVVMPLSFLYNSNFMWWTTNYLYEMKLEWIVVWCRDAT